MDNQAKIQAELEQAEMARAGGNEGRARVCARRAAGIAAGVFLARHARLPGHTAGAPDEPSFTDPASSPSAYTLLQRLAVQSDVDPVIRQAAVHLTMRVSQDFTLPQEVDLIAEAKMLCARLLPD